jgi:hypothetical protein
VTAQTVEFDRPLRDLDQADEQAWRAWLVQHQLDHISIACPSQLIYREATKRKPTTVTVELLTRDNTGSFRVKETVTFSGPLGPFPGGYRVDRAA